MTFCVVAIIMTFYFSLTDFNMYSSPKFVGLKNYISIFKNDTFYAALVNTVKYVIVTVPAPGDFISRYCGVYCRKAEK